MFGWSSRRGRVASWDGGVAFGRVCRDWDRCVECMDLEEHRRDIIWINGMTIEICKSILFSTCS